MNARRASLAAFAGAVLGLVYLYYQHALFASGPAGIAVQALAVLLMVWARLTFGLRSFHAAANPTAGGLVSHGPYRYWRHPIYAAVVYFAWAGVLSNPLTIETLGGASLVTAGLVARMLLEERFLLREMPEYREYARRTKRVIPFVV